MSELMQQMIDREIENHAKALAAIEARAGLIQEAETLAATLRSGGVASACAMGYVTPPFLSGGDASVHVYVDALADPGEAIAQALRDADLRIRIVEQHPGGGYCSLNLEGLDTRLDIPSKAWPALFDALNPPRTREAA